jgi:Fibronectin type III domain
LNPRSHGKDSPKNHFQVVFNLAVFILFIMSTTLVQARRLSCRPISKVYSFTASILFLWVGLIGAVRADSRVTLGWDASPDGNIAGYKLHYRRANESGMNVIQLGNVTSHILANLVAKIPYYAFVTAYNTTGLESEPSNQVSFTLPEENLPPGALWLDARNSKMEANGLFTLHVRGSDPRSIVVVQASTDLIGWQSIGMFALGAEGKVWFVDYLSPNYSRRFYRAFVLNP